MYVMRDLEDLVAGGGLDLVDADERAEPALEGLKDAGLGEDGPGAAVEGEHLALQAGAEVGPVDALAGGGEDDLADQLLEVAARVGLLTQATEAGVDGEREGEGLDRGGHAGGPNG
jgi:hypothetical protein